MKRIEFISLQAISKFTNYPLNMIAEWINRRVNKKNIYKGGSTGWVTFRQAMIISVGVFLDINFVVAARFYYKAKRMIKKEKANEKKRAKANEKKRAKAEIASGTAVITAATPNNN